VTDNVIAALELALYGDDAQHDLSDLSLARQPGDAPDQREGVCVTGSIFVVAEAREVYALFSHGPSPEIDQPVDAELLSPSRP
jgi:hypothetical protein